MCMKEPPRPYCWVSVVTLRTRHHRDIASQPRTTPMIFRARGLSLADGLD
jgi:hypothetical protein